MINFPYTNFHRLNLNWLVKTVEKLVEDVKNIPFTIARIVDSRGFVTASEAAAAAPVQSVNGQTGAVVLDAADVGAKPASYAAPVDSVNGKTGTVVLSAADVDAKPSSYAAPVDSVNGKTGAVVLSAADVGAKPSSYAAPVDSVDGQTGAVTTKYITFCDIIESSMSTGIRQVGRFTSNRTIDYENDLLAVYVWGQQVVMIQPWSGTELRVVGNNPFSTAQTNVRVRLICWSKTPITFTGTALV